MQKDFNQVAQSWLDGNYDEETKRLVMDLKNNDPAGLEDAFYRNLEFGTGGLRGVMGVGTNRMNKYTVGMATQGLANYMKKNCEGDLSVCVSYDSRNNSKEFAKITADVLSANGIHVYLSDTLRPIPLLSYTVRSKKATAGVMITASHNPKEYNGYKVFWSDGAQIVACRQVYSYGGGSHRRPFNGEIRIRAGKHRNVRRRNGQCLSQRCPHTHPFT